MSSTVCDIAPVTQNIYRPVYGAETVEYAGQGHVSIWGFFDEFIHLRKKKLRRGWKSVLHAPGASRNFSQGLDK